MFMMGQVGVVQVMYFVGLWGIMACIILVCFRIDVEVWVKEFYQVGVQVQVGVPTSRSVSV